MLSPLGMYHHHAAPLLTTMTATALLTTVVVFITTTTVNPQPSIASPNDVTVDYTSSQHEVLPPKHCDVLVPPAASCTRVVAYLFAQLDLQELSQSPVFVSPHVQSPREAELQ